MTDDDKIMALDEALERCRKLEEKCVGLEAEVTRIESQKGMCECCERRVSLLYVINPRTYAPREFCKDCYRGYTVGMMDRGVRCKIVEWVSDNPLLAGVTSGFIVILALLIADYVGVF